MMEALQAFFWLVVVPLSFATAICYAIGNAVDRCIKDTIKDAVKEAGKEIDKENKERGVRWILKNLAL